MKKVLVLSIIVLVCFLCMLAYTQKEGEEVAKVDPKAELQKSVERGKALFNDAKLGTSGMTCNSCHAKGGTVDSKMGEMSMKAFDALNAKYPKYFGMAKRVMTLDQVINWCIKTPLKGEPLSWDDQKLTDLTAYVASVKPEKATKEKKEE